MSTSSERSSVRGSHEQFEQDLDQNQRRLAELDQNLRTITEKIDQAAKSCGRSGDEISVTVVTKTYPVADVHRLYELGIRDFGENRDQEAAPKAAELSGYADFKHDVNWHFVGQLQTKKTNSVVRYASIVESVDRSRLVHALDRSVTAHRAAELAPLSCLIQVNLDPAAPVDRGGAQPADIAGLAQEITAAPSLSLSGLMAVAPLGIEPRKSFEKLADIQQKLLKNFPEAGMISAGMSSDFELAIEYGATHIRLGAAVLGQR